MVHLVLITEVILSIFILLLVYTTLFAIGYFIWERFCRYYQNWKTKKRNLRWLRRHKLELERKLRKEERKKYPLFYWRELCSKQRRELIEEKLEDGNF